VHKNDVPRSTFADANKSRPADFFKDMFAEIYSLCAVKAPKHTFRFKSKLFSLDATVKLCLSLFLRTSFRRANGGIKMHTLPDHTAISRHSRPSLSPKPMKTA
jgi:hypothetical protein